MDDLALPRHDMKERVLEISPRVKARLAGLFQVLEAVAVSGQMYILGMFVVTRNPEATAANILANEPMFQLGFTCSLIAVVCNLVRGLFIYELFKPVSGSISVFAVFVFLVGCTIQALAGLLYLGPLIVLKSVASGYSTTQLQELAYVFVSLSKQTFNTYVAFFGLWLAVLGCLIVRSDFMPRIIGVLVFVCGVGWMFYLFPPLARQMFPLMLTGSLIGEAPLALWLLVKGVDVQRWRTQASRQGA